MICNILIKTNTADGKPLPSNARIEGSYLVIPEASVEDDSMYMCRASNSYGSAEGGAQLQVRGNVYYL